jgi:hypothetical protein
MNNDDYYGRVINNARKKAQYLNDDLLIKVKGKGAITLAVTHYVFP